MSPTCGRITALVENLLVMNKALAGDLPPEEHSRLEAACEEADREIDRIVYALYGLTEEEIAVVEGATHERPRPYQGCAQQPYRIEVILAKNRHVKKNPGR